MKKWYTLDNTAKIFPSLISQRRTTVFRISAILKERITPTKLQSALDRTILRYPYYQVCLKKGMFWSFLQEVKHQPTIELEIEQPCRPMHQWFDNKLLFRVLYFNNRISVEFSHILTDGTGAQQFLHHLLEEYVYNIKPFPREAKPLTIEQRYKEEEDSYKRYYKSDIPPPRGGGIGAFHLPGPIVPKETLRIITGIVPTAEIKKVAKQKGITITEFLVSLYLFTLQDFNKTNIKKRYLKPLRLMVPVNLRKLYPSNSMRNFFLSIFPGIDLRLGDYTFEEICQTVHHYMQVEVNEKYINQQISKNIKTAQNPLIRIIPLWIKAPIEKLIYKHYSNKKHSGVLTNLGAVKLPQEVEKLITGFRFIPNPNPTTKCNIGIISFKEELAISFGNLTTYRDVERIFFQKLRAMEVSVTIETNE